jgi:RHS repeat-associated protein
VQGSDDNAWLYQFAEDISTTSYTQNSLPLYGSSNSSMLEGGFPSQVVKCYGGETSTNNTYSRKLGYKRYELSDHLGNVRVVITDKRFLEDENNDNLYDQTDILHADIVMANDYYPFGMISRSANATGEYRFGFNGKLKDTEWTGNEGSHIDFGARIYDSRIGRWLALDPLAAKYPDLSPYAFVADNPIIFIDPDGRDIVPTNEGAARATSALIQKYDQGDVMDEVFKSKTYLMVDPSTGEKYLQYGSGRTNNPFTDKESFQKAMRKAGMKVDGEELDESWALYQAIVSKENIEVEAWSIGESKPRLDDSDKKPESPTTTVQDVDGYKNRKTENDNFTNAVNSEEVVTKDGLDKVMDQEEAEMDANNSGEGYLFYKNETENPKKQGTKGIIIIDGRSNMSKSLGNALKNIYHEN